MANMSLNVNMENLTEAERNQILALVKKSTGENKVWKPEENETYYYIKAAGVINCQEYYNTSSFSTSNYEIGNCFKTKEEAEFAVEKLKVTTKLKRFAQEHNEKIDWHDSDCNGINWKYYLAYEYPIKSIIICATERVQGADVYFTSKELAQEAIKAIGADRLKKYYFEVED